MNHTPITSARL